MKTEIFLFVFTFILIAIFYPHRQADVKFRCGLCSLVTPPVRGSNILTARLCRVPSNTALRRLNLQCRYVHT